MILRKHRHILTVIFIVTISLTHSQEEIDTTFVQGDEIKTVQVLANKVPSQSLNIGHREAQSLDDFVARQTGVFVKNYGEGQVATISTRGMNASQTDIVWNGLQLNSPMLGQTDLSLLPLQQIDRIYFSNTQQNISKQVNLTHDFLGTEGHMLTIGERVGSYSRFVPSFSYEYNSSSFSSATSFKYAYGKNNFRYKNPSLPFSPVSRLDNADTKQFNIAHSMRFKLKKQNFDLHYLQSIATREIPPTLFERLSTKMQDDKLYAFILKYHLTPKKMWTGSIQTGYHFQRNDYYATFSSAPAVSKVNSWQTKIEARKNFNFKLYWKNELNLIYENGKSTNYKENHQRFRGVYYTFIQKDFKNHTVLKFGLSEQWVDKDFTIPLPFVEVKQHSYLPNNRHSTFNITYAQHQRFPTFNDLYWSPGGNDTLDAERSNNIEASWELKGRFTNREFSTKTTMFHTIANDYIQWQPTNQGYWSPSNVGKIYSRGWEQELDFTFYFNKKIRWSTSMRYTYTRTTNRNEDRSYQLIYVPFHQWSWRNDFSTKIINWQIGQRAVSQNFVIKDNSRSIERFYLLDLMVYKDFIVRKSTFTFQFSVNNIFNKAYQTVLNYPMMGRNFQLNFNYKFQKAKQ